MEKQTQAAVLIAALNKVTEVLFNDAVNGHAHDAQFVTREQLSELYEIARLALVGAEQSA